MFSEEKHLEIPSMVRKTATILLTRSESSVTVTFTKKSAFYDISLEV